MKVLHLTVSMTLWTTSQAIPSYRERIPNGNNIVGVDSVGHLNPDGGGDRNEFGLAFSTAGRSWTKALCESDSDGDGITNGEELGDPCCLFVAGKEVQLVKDVAQLSNPGDADSKPTTTAQCVNGVNAQAEGDSSASYMGSLSFTAVFGFIMHMFYV